MGFRPCRECGCREQTFVIKPIVESYNDFGYRYRIKCHECDNVTDFKLTQSEANRAWNFINDIRLCNG